MTIRRVVTGLNEQGQSCVIVDGPPHGFGAGDGGYVWRTHAVPADNAPAHDIAPTDFSYDLFHDGGTNFFYVTMEPGAKSSVHATDTIDYITMVAGEAVLVLEAEEVTLRAGDVLVDRGVVHQWRNDGAQRCVYTVVTVPAHPVARGRTV